jgi:hypothetical protein
MTGSSFTPEQEAQIRKIAREQATSICMVPFLFSLAAMVIALLSVVICVAQWIFA